jgi:hypothetical protein
MNNTERPAIKDVTEARDKVGRLTPEMVRNATTDIDGSASNGNTPLKDPPLAAQLSKERAEAASETVPTAVEA